LVVVVVVAADDLLVVVVVVVPEAAVVVVVGATVVVVTGADVPSMAWRRATSVVAGTLGRALVAGPNPTVTSWELRSFRLAGSVV
jgi:hypothetical protein